MTTTPRFTWRAVGTETGLYLALAIAITWPLATRLSSDVPGDYGDPLFLSWIMTWVLRHLTAALTGDLTALDQFWNANIFYPEPGTLAMSDHFVAQAVPMLPVWWLTHNPTFVYNIAFLVTFVLTGLAVSWLTRAFTGGALAPFVAGVFAAFNTYRLSVEISHLQVLSVQWLPFLLLAVHRYIASGSHAWLVASGVSLIALNLSTPYYMLFAAPIVAIFVIVDLALLGQIRNLSRWLGLAVAAVCVTLVTTPFVLPYIALQRRLGLRRPLEEVIAHSATFEAYSVYVLPWAGVPLALAACGLVAIAMRRADVSRAHTLLFGALFVLAVWLSFGPVVQPYGVPGLYRLLWDYVPGFDGVRVVHRYAAIALIFMAVLAGIGAAVVSRVPRIGTALVVGLTVVFLWQIWPTPFPVNLVVGAEPLRPPPVYLTPSAELPPIYRAVQGLDRTAVLVELPFGPLAYEIRYVFFSAIHQQRLMNGYSGFTPPSAVARQDALRDPLTRPSAALGALRGATHVIVHQDAWRDETGRQVVAWLQSVGAESVASDAGAELLQLQAIRRDARLSGDRTRQAASWR